MDLRYIENKYENMSDGELIRVAIAHAKGLRPEVIEILEKEVKKRNLSPNLLKGVLAQNKEYTFEEINEYSKLLSNQACPICNNSSEKLNGTIAHSVKSFIFFTFYETKPTIACPDCLDKVNNKAMISSLLLGWWGIPSGLIKTPIYIYRNYKAKKANRLDISNNTLLNFTLEHIGVIEIYKNDQPKLEELIKAKNH